MANLRMEVHLFVSLLDDLENQRGGEDGDEGVETWEGDEYDKQARVEDPTDDEPMDARKGDNVKDVQPLVVDLLEDGTLECGARRSSRCIYSYAFTT